MSEYTSDALWDEDAEDDVLLTCDVCGKQEPDLCLVCKACQSQIRRLLAMGHTPEQIAGGKPLVLRTIEVEARSWRWATGRETEEDKAERARIRAEAVRLLGIEKP